MDFLDRGPHYFVHGLPRLGRTAQCDRLGDIHVQLDAFLMRMGRDQPHLLAACEHFRHRIMQSGEHLVAGTRAQELVTQRGFGHALPIWPDARAFPRLPESAITKRVDPLYGRGPDAKLPAAAP